MHQTQIKSKQVSKISLPLVLESWNPLFFVSLPSWSSLPYLTSLSPLKRTEQFLFGVSGNYNVSLYKCLKLNKAGYNTFNRVRESASHLALQKKSTTQGNCNHKYIHSLPQRKWYISSIQRHVKTVHSFFPKPSRETPIYSVSKLQFPGPNVITIRVFKHQH
jgi:hypothetical protein